MAKFKISIIRPLILNVVGLHTMGGKQATCYDPVGPQIENIDRILSQFFRYVSSSAGYKRFAHITASNLRCVPSINLVTFVKRDALRGTASRPASTTARQTWGYARTGNNDFPYWPIMPALGVNPAIPLRNPITFEGRETNTVWNTDPTWSTIRISGAPSLDADNEAVLPSDLMYLPFDSNVSTNPTLDAVKVRRSFVYYVYMNNAMANRLEISTMAGLLHAQKYQAFATLKNGYITSAPQATLTDPKPNVHLNDYADSLITLNSRELPAGVPGTQLSNRIVTRSRHDLAIIAKAGVSKMTADAAGSLAGPAYPLKGIPYYNEADLANNAGYGKYIRLESGSHEIAVEEASVIAITDLVSVAARIDGQVTGNEWLSVLSMPTVCQSFVQEVLEFEYVSNVEDGIPAVIPVVSPVDTIYDTITSNWISGACSVHYPDLPLGSTNTGTDNSMIFPADPSNFSNPITVHVPCSKRHFVTYPNV